jgi:hypothetical protein
MLVLLSSDYSPRYKERCSVLGTHGCSDPALGTEWRRTIVQSPKLNVPVSAIEPMTSLISSGR